jgi:flagellin
MFDSNFPKGPKSMSNSVLTNSSALMALQNLNRTNERLGETQSRINTGLKVQGAKDNAAVWAIAQNQRADTSAYEAVKTSLNRATSIADVSLAAGQSISDLLIELRAKATAAADPSSSEATRKAYNDEFQTLLKSLQSFADNATFDGANILNGMVDGVRPGTPAGLTPLDFLANTEGATITVNRQDFSLQGLNLVQLDLVTLAPNLLTQAAAEDSLTRVEAALSRVSAGLAELGAQAKQIESHTKFVSKLMDALEVGVGNLVDADLAKESARLQALQVQQQLGAQALGIANQAPQIILSLFRN